MRAVSRVGVRFASPNGSLKSPFRAFLFRKPFPAYRRFACGRALLPAPPQWRASGSPRSARFALSCSLLQSSPSPCKVRFAFLLALRSVLCLLASVRLLRFRFFGSCSLSACSRFAVRSQFSPEKAQPQAVPPCRSLPACSVRSGGLIAKACRLLLLLRFSPP